MMNAIIHITDLHFGKTELQLFKDTEELANSIFSAVSKRIQDVEDTTLVISGDIVYQGKLSAYNDAKWFIRRLCSLLSIKTDHVIICPGNHDILLSESSDVFKGINNFIYDLAGNSSLVFKSKTNVRKQLGQLDFLVINSVFHRDHKYGLVDLESLPDFGNSEKIKIAVIHHNLLNIYKDDTSSIRNAYQFVMKLVNEKVDLVLHGHQHFLEIFPIGNNNCLIVGAGSLNFKMNDGQLNQFNVVLVDSSRAIVYRYVYMADLQTDGRVSGWKELNAYELNR